MQKNLYFFVTILRCDLYQKVTGVLAKAKQTVNGGQCMRKVRWSGLILLLVLVFGVGTVFAGDRDQKRDKKRDGSCQNFISVQDGSMNLAAKRDRTRTRDKDRSCLQLAADRDQKRDKKRDGSCQNFISVQDGSMNLAAKRDRTRTRDKDRSCLQLAADRDQKRDKKRDGSCRS
jgi:hypothetical protein